MSTRIYFSQVVENDLVNILLLQREEGRYEEKNGGRDGWREGGRGENSYFLCISSLSGSPSAHYSPSWVRLKPGELWVPLAGARDLTTGATIFSLHCAHEQESGTARKS